MPATPTQARRCSRDRQSTGSLERIVAAAKRDAANHRLAMRAPHNTAYERTILRRKLVRCEAILAVDEVVQRIRQRRRPGAFDAELDDLLS